MQKAPPVIQWGITEPEHISWNDVKINIAFGNACICKNKLFGLCGKVAVGSANQGEITLKHP